MRAAAGPSVRCPTCRRPISPGSFTCSYCGAPVAAIWEDCRLVCYFLRLAAVFLLASLITGVIVVVVTDVLGLTGLGIRIVAIISAVTASADIGLWKLADVLRAPPAPWGSRPGVDGTGSSSDGKASITWKER